MKFRIVGFVRLAVVAGFGKTAQVFIFPMGLAQPPTAELDLNRWD